MNFEEPWLLCIGRNGYFPAGAPNVISLIASSLMSGLLRALWEIVELKTAELGTWACEDGSCLRSVADGRQLDFER